MRRHLLRLAPVWIAVVGAFALPSGVLAAQPATVKGTVTAVEPSDFTIQTAGRRTGIINALTYAANAVTKGDYPYVWGGGHAEAGAASKGIKGPGHNGRRIGYDCSGSVAAVLAGAGLWPAGSPVPSDAGVIRQLMHEKLIARGPGAAPEEVTLYDDPGVHIFMNIDGRFFGTSDGGSGNASQPRDGAGWVDDGALDATNRAFKRYHFLPAVLRNQTTYGHMLTFQIEPNPSIVDGVEAGDDLQVTYQGTGVGSMVATAIGYVGALTTAGTVTSIATDGSSFTVQAANGPGVTLSTGTNSELTGGLELGDTVEVTYTKGATGVLTARALTVTATPVASEASGTILAIAGDLSTFTIETADGEDMTFSTGGVTGILAGFQVGAGVHVNYTQAGDGTLTALQLTGTASGSYGGGGGSYGGGGGSYGASGGGPYGGGGS